MFVGSAYNATRIWIAMQPVRALAVVAAGHAMVAAADGAAGAI